jgi:hypothetical protein
MSYRPGCAEFIGCQEPPVRPGVRKEGDDPVKVMILLFPAGKTAIPFGNEGATAAGTAPGPFKGNAGHTTGAETIPSFPGVKEGSTAEGAAGGEKIFPDIKKKP